MELYNVRS
jgi:hypothetical protein